jgi:hypothetical protein
MKSKLMTASLLSLFLTCSGLISGLCVGAEAKSNLGLVLDVLPSDDPTISRLTQGQALWFVIPPGESKSRQIRITSSSNVSEQVTLSVGYLNRINGVATIDDSKKSETAPWASFDPPAFTLSPGASKTVNFTYSIPANTDVGIHEAFLFAYAKSNGPASKAEYSVPQAARIASPIFLGVGTTAQIDTDFSIDNVTGVVVDGVRNLKIDFKNTGKTPLNLSGNIQLNSTEFKNRLVGPLNFTSVVIRPGIKGYVLVPSPNELTPGEWKILVTATQISNTKIREFTKVIDFKEPSVLIPNLIRITLVIFFAFIFGVALRVLRAPRSSKSGDKRVEPKTFLKSRRNRAPEIDVELDDIDRILEEILNRSSSRKSTTIRKTVTSSPKNSGKKSNSSALKKKSIAKKAVAKKPGAKKITKNVAKKAPKSGAKKVAKKPTSTKSVKKVSRNAAR